MACTPNVHSAETDRGRTGQAAGPRREDRPARGRRGLPAARASDPPAGRGPPGAVRRDRRVPRRAGAEPGPAGAVRHRCRRQRRGRQVHHRACAAGAAGPLGASPARRPGDHRRFPLLEFRAATPQPHASQRFSGKLRPSGADALRHRRQVRCRRGVRTGLLPPAVRHRPRREADHRALRHRDPRGAQRAADRTRADGLGPVRLLGLRRRAHRGHRGVVHLPVPVDARRRVRRPGLALPPLLDAVG